MFEVSYSEVQFYFLNPTWGQGFIGDNKVVEIACEQIRVNYQSSLTKQEFFDSANPTRFRKTSQNNGSITLTIPLTAENFDFLFDAQNQDLDFSFPPKAYFAGILYEGLLFKSLSFELSEYGSVLMQMNFDFNAAITEALEIIHDICYLTETVITDDEVLTDEDGNILTDEFDVPLVTEDFVLPLETEDRFLFDAVGNFIIDASCAAGSFTETKDRFSVSTLLQVAGYANLASSDRLLNMYLSDLSLNVPTNADQIDFNDLNLISMSLDYKCDYKGIKKLGECFPSKLLKQEHELTSTLNFAMLEEQSQTNFIGTQSTDGDSYAGFICSILLKDVDGNAVSTTITIDSQLYSMDSSVSSLGIPQGSIQVKQQIT